MKLEAVLRQYPVLAVVKDAAGLQAALASDCRVVSVLHGAIAILATACSRPNRRLSWLSFLPICWRAVPIRKR